MRLFLQVCIFLLASEVVFAADVPKVGNGSVKRIEGFDSEFIGKRTVDIWLPDGFKKEGDYEVLYMHDGQMLFDAANTWNKQEWGVDETAGRLIKEKRIRKLIVVGVWNAGSERWKEYFPQRVLDYLEPETRKRVLKNGLESDPGADRYLKFLVYELKPFIDRELGVCPKQECTFVGGSSMGGLISIYAAAEYPRVFGGAIAMSTHLPLMVDRNGYTGKEPEAFRRYLEDRLRGERLPKLYFDYGDKTLDALYPPLQEELDKTLVTIGYRKKNWITKYFPGDDHSEQSWRNRFETPLRFMFGK
ncbi:MAG: alpha/beta hydrolase-fold protein [Pyrinomonadaceae bacterium]